MSCGTSGGSSRSILDPVRADDVVEEWRKQANAQSIQKYHGRKGKSIERTQCIQLTFSWQKQLFTHTL
jgi:hypothetical protein